MRADILVAVSSADAWAVGWVQLPTKFAPYFTVTLHWNGTAWSRIRSPNPGSDSSGGISQLYAVSADSSTDAWAVGKFACGNGTLILHWNGTAWSAT
jgi:hypothetical protein